MPLDDLSNRYSSFGWNVIECNGHDCDNIIQALKVRKSNMPTVVIVNTIKGCGSLVMENKADWHHLVSINEEYE